MIEHYYYLLYKYKEISNELNHHSIQNIFYYLRKVDLFHLCIDYLKENDLEAEIANAKLLVISHFRLIELNDNRVDDKELFEKVSNNIFIDLIRCT